MVKDGTNRDGLRVRAGAKSDALNEKLAKGRPATRLEDPTIDPLDFQGGNIGEGAALDGTEMPEPSEYLSEVQRDGKPLDLLAYPIRNSMQAGISCVRGGKQFAFLDLVKQVERERS